LCAFSHETNAAGSPCYSGMNFEPTFSPLSDKIYKVNVTSNNQQITILQKFRDSASPLSLGAAYDQEVLQTSQLLVSTNTMLSVFVKSDFNQNPYQPVSSFNSYNPIYNALYPNNDGPQDSISTIQLQYGSPQQTKENPDFTGFDAAATLSNLKSSGLTNSLQARILDKGGYARVFQIESVVNW
jgi:hypothetical protein